MSQEPRRTPASEVVGVFLAVFSVLGAGLLVLGMMMDDGHNPVVSLLMLIACLLVTVCGLLIVICGKR